MLNIINYKLSIMKFGRDFSTSNINLNHNKDIILNSNSKDNDKNKDKNIIIKDDILSPNSNHHSDQAIISLKDIQDFKNNLQQQLNNPYIGLLRDKEDSKYKFGKLQILPKSYEYNKYENIADWEFRIKELITTHLAIGVTYDLAVLGRDVLNEEYITYGKHFLINNDSNIDAIITKIQGYIDIKSLSLNSGEIAVAKNNLDMDSPRRFKNSYIWYKICFIWYRCLQCC